MTVSTGKEVSIEYILKLEDRSVVDTNVGADPLGIADETHAATRMAHDRGQPTTDADSRASGPCP